MMAAAPEGREKRLLALLDCVPEEVRVKHILPHLSPQVLVWLNRDNYIKYHSVLRPLIPNTRSERFPLGKWETYVRHMIREDCSFVVAQLLSDHARVWLRHSGYHYKTRSFPSYLHFLFQYSLDVTSARCRKCINDKAIDLIGKKWYKRTRERSRRWSN